ncbi:hypothetical protein AX774_g2788 [Zancudomyces culisetae]|uniref:Uncharacterized protein n=1 Tax=Zancudomyces culisetae TaxID=1213189 RepID=A0A1R1PS45_ZANCU|nr:hypothetical protein AX774_g2788 [Zancudomyces culisetae]|eukprot:OMH83712.1 hypothetical protein AX774_g2788 [Zancudomyces culisetae]
MPVAVEAIQNTGISEFIISEKRVEMERDKIRIERRKEFLREFKKLQRRAARQVIYQNERMGWKLNVEASKYFRDRVPEFGIVELGDKTEYALECREIFGKYMVTKMCTISGLVKGIDDSGGFIVKRNEREAKKAFKAQKGGFGTNNSENDDPLREFPSNYESLMEELQNEYKGSISSSSSSVASITSTTSKTSVPTVISAATSSDKDTGDGDSKAANMRSSGESDTKNPSTNQAKDENDTKCGTGEQSDRLAKIESMNEQVTLEVTPKTDDGVASPVVGETAGNTEIEVLMTPEATGIAVVHRTSKNSKEIKEKQPTYEVPTQQANGKDFSDVDSIKGGGFSGTEEYEKDVEEPHKSIQSQESMHDDVITNTADVEELEKVAKEIAQKMKASVVHLYKQKQREREGISNNKTPRTPRRMSSGENMSERDKNTHKSVFYEHKQNSSIGIQTKQQHKGLKDTDNNRSRDDDGYAEDDEGESLHQIKGGKQRAAEELSAPGMQTKLMQRWWDVGNPHTTAKEHIQHSSGIF